MKSITPKQRQLLRTDFSQKGKKANINLLLMSDTQAIACRSAAFNTWFSG